MKKGEGNLGRRGLAARGAAFALAAALLACPVLAGQASAANGGGRAARRSQEAANGLELEVLSVLRGINIYYDDRAYLAVDVNGNEVYPFVYNGTTYLPARSISGIFGAAIRWDGEAHCVYIERGKAEVNIPARDRADTAPYSVTVTALKGARVSVDQVELLPKDANGDPVGIYIIDGTTYLPVRAVSEVFDTPITWEGGNNAVYLGKHEVQEPPLPYPNLSPEYNQKIAQVKAYLVEIEPYLSELDQRSYKVGALWNYAYTKLDEVEGWRQETGPGALDAYVQQLDALERQVNDLRLLTTGSTAGGNFASLKSMIDQLGPNGTQADLDDYSFDVLYNIAMHILAHYQQALEESGPEQVSALYAQIDAAYHAAALLR